MGDPKRKRKQFERPGRLWNVNRIEEESGLREEFGLKNTREVWKAKTVLRSLRREARRLQAGKGSGLEKRSEQLLGRVKKYFVGKKDATLDDVLSLTVRDILARRLQTVITAKHMARTPKQARQFIVHGHVKVNGKRVNAPSYLVSFEEEGAVEWWGEPMLTPEKAESTAEEDVEEEKPEEKKEKEESLAEMAKEKPKDPDKGEENKE
jgi:small subunit ribosomal protein S4